MLQVSISNASLNRQNMPVVCFNVEFEQVYDSNCLYPKETNQIQYQQGVFQEFYFGQRLVLEYFLKRYCALFT